MLRHRTDVSSFGNAKKRTVRALCGLGNAKQNHAEDLLGYAVLGIGNAQNRQAGEL